MLAVAGTFAAIVVGGLAGVMFSGFGSSPSAALSTRTPVGNVSAMELWRSYNANEVAADNYYKGRVFRVSGTIRSIDKDFMDHVVIQLASPNDFESTSATVDASGASQAASLSKGDRVSLTCVIRGRFIGSPALDDCTF